MTTGNITIYSKLRKYWTSNLALKRNKLAKSKIYIFFFETYRGQTLTKSINITFNKNCQRTLNILHLFPNFIDLFPINKWILNFGPILPTLSLTSSVGHSTNTKKRISRKYYYKMMTCYQHQKLQHFWQSHYQSSRKLLQQMLFHSFYKYIYIYHYFLLH